jgi:hypothetical protein
MKLRLTAFVAACVLCVADVAFAQHSDIEVTAFNGKLIVAPSAEGYVFEGELGETIPNFGAEPGFEAEDGELQPNTELSFNLLSSLLYWDGTQFTTPANNEQLAISKATFTTLVTPTSGAQPGFIFGEADDEGGFHEDLEFLLSRPDSDPNTAVGAYGLWLEIDSPQYEASNGFILMLNNGLDEEHFEAGVAAAGQLVPEPASLGLLATSAVFALAMARRRVRG